MYIFKRNYFRKLISVTLLFISFTVESQSINPEFSQKMWSATWIKVPQTDGVAYGVYLFRKEIVLEKVSQSFPIYISADNKYQLFVNGELIARGPAKGDAMHWNYEQLDLAPFLKVGKNCIAARVSNDGPHVAESQKSFISGLIIQGTSPESAVINTNNTWRSIQDLSYSPILISDHVFRPGMKLPGYYVAGPSEKVDMAKSIIDWEKNSFNDQNWKNAEIIFPGIPKLTVGLDAGNSWRLVPSALPQMESVPQRFKKLRKATGVKVASLFPEKPTAINIPANSNVTLLLDQTFITNAYPKLVFSGGKRSDITLTYSESLYDGNYKKGNRNDIQGKNIFGRKDSIVSSGTKNQYYTPLSYRTYRYVELNIATKDDPLIIDDISAVAVAYPFQLNAKLDSKDDEMDEILKIGWRTAKLCAMDTYMDCPYWEQLQYIGDTRIQALVSLYNSGDDRLLKNALNLIDLSRQPEGITQSRYPTNNAQVIPPFSLFYIGMLNDYLMYGSDRDFIKERIAGTRQIIGYFEKFQNKDGSVVNMPGWTFTDWVPGWERGMAPFGKDGSSAVLDLQLLLAYQNAEKIEREFGMSVYVEAYKLKIEQLSQTIKDKYWDESKHLFADNSDKDKFSQHANSLAILAGLVKDNEANDIAKLILNDTTLSQASIYFKYYVHQALTKAGLGDDYMKWLGLWRKNIELGLTTWGETSDVDGTRSDCHAWGSSPNIEFYRIILGIDSASPNFKTVKIEPHLGTIKAIAGEIPHPNGKIKVKYLVVKNGLEAEINLPDGITGEFVWKGTKTPLTSGLNTIKL